MNRLSNPARPRYCGFAAALLCLLCSTASNAHDLRIASYTAELTRKGPGLLLRDILSGKDAQITAVLKVLTKIRPDVLALQGFDHDTQNHALVAFQAALAQHGHPMPFAFSRPPNSGLINERIIGMDMDGNGRTGEPRDAQGYGRFTGQGAMAVLSTYPLGPVRDFSGLLWAEFPQAIAPRLNGRPFPSPEAFARQRLSHVAHWDILVTPPGGPPFHLLTFHASPPVFDGDEDRNGRRNHDEILFWKRYLDGDLPWPAPEAPVIIAGNANLDPERGAGRHEAIGALLSDTRLQDPRPQRPPAPPDSPLSSHTLATVDWPEPTPGNLRVSYVLPSARFKIINAGVFWPPAGAPFHEAATRASRHRLVWVDVGFRGSDHKSGVTSRLHER